MIIDDIMGHVRRSHQQIEKALLEARRAVADELGWADHQAVRLNVSEVARTVGPYTSTFFECFPDHAMVDHATRSEIVRKLDKLKICMFMMQFPERVQDVIQEFRFGNRLASEASTELAFVYGPLLRALDHAASAANPKEQLPFLMRLAADTMASLPDDTHPATCRALMEIIEYTVHACPGVEHRKTVFQVPPIDTFHEFPANDNQFTAPMHMG